VSSGISRHSILFIRRFLDTLVSGIHVFSSLESGVGAICTLLRCVLLATQLLWTNGSLVTSNLGVSSWLVLRLLIDTSTWLDLAASRTGQQWIVPLRVLKHQGRLELLVPPVVLEEFSRNRMRSEAAVTTRVLDRLRQLRRELREYAGEKHEQIWLAETAQHIPLVNAMAPQNYREIDELLRSGTTAEPTDLEYTRVVQRGLNRRAPFTAEKNSTADALIIETYARQLANTNDVYAFVTSNHKDFSLPNGDYRLPHPDVADLFDGVRSRYIYQVQGLHELLVDQLGNEYLEEYHEVEFLIDDEEPRTLAEIIEAAAEYFDRVWYVRSIAMEDDRPIPDDIRAGMMAARERVETTYGRDELWRPIGPGHEEAWQYGYISGKLATLRWVLGSEWDFLDT
jgi:PIN domain